MRFDAMDKQLRVYEASADLKRRDVIECPISGDLDISGRDLSKALGLFRKSNPLIRASDGL